MPLGEDGPQVLNQHLDLGRWARPPPRPPAARCGSTGITALRTLPAGCPLARTALPAGGLAVLLATRALGGLDGLRLGPVLAVDERRVERHLPQGGQRLERDEARLGGVLLQQPEDPLPLAGQALVVGLAVLGAQLDGQDLLGLGGQVRGHLLLGAPQQEGPHPAPQPPQRLCVPAVDRLAVDLPEALRVGQQPRRRDAHKRPQVHERVLQRRARDRDGRRRAQPPHRLVGGRGVVLDELGLVTHHPGPVLGDELLLAQAHDRVGGDDDVAALHDLRHSLLALGGGPPHGPHPQPRAEALGLLHPGADDGGRCDDEHRSGPLRLSGVTGAGRLAPLGLLAQLDEALDGGEHLDGLAQSHVVGQDPAEARLAQEVQPPVALELVGAQRRPHPLGHGRPAGPFTGPPTGAARVVASDRPSTGGLGRGLGGARPLQQPPDPLLPASRGPLDDAE